MRTNNVKKVYYFFSLGFQPIQDDFQHDFAQMTDEADSSVVLGFQPIQDDFQHDFARMTDEADSSVVLAELQVVLFRECNNQRLSPWGRPFSCSPDSVTDLC